MVMVANSSIEETCLDFCEILKLVNNKVHYSLNKHEGDWLVYMLKP